MTTLFILKTGEHTYTVTDTSHAGSQARSAEMKLFASWNALLNHLTTLGIPERVYPSLKKQLDETGSATINKPV